MSSFENKKYLIFGATGCVGSLVAKQLVGDGARMMLTGRDEEKLKRLSELLGQPYVVVEARQPPQIEEAFEAAVEQMAGIDGVVNCMGSVLLKPAHLTSLQEWHETLAVNLTSSFLVAKMAGKLMKKSGGSVVLVSSSAAQIGMSNHEAIAAAKAGVEGLTRSAASTYAGQGIRFNAVAPGLVRSNMTRSIWENESLAEFSKEMHALGRLGEPEDIASAISWLLDPSNGWITGQVINVDGGLSRVMPRKKMTK
ncbi:3-oxoacyl-[acyl-carrier-protein] reductase FabG [Polystyrenella longa]|uniref:3-oxoacyl-[acyl-carrier-protein] reductase FabG n=1 Tax=Polystyrenella longa TaxID=2528007 RepID=A0A518CGS8_9PLAN|nr:SDR family oxidoreductase [Polystyrenella longa]QDU78438.1 3-oxoacyl-[acyl-carrier-protein] reductase FabG [Polystyrenella longa]